MRLSQTVVQTVMVPSIGLSPASQSDGSSELKGAAVEPVPVVELEGLLLVVNWVAAD